MYVCRCVDIYHLSPIWMEVSSLALIDTREMDVS